MNINPKLSGDSVAGIDHQALSIRWNMTNIERLFRSFNELQRLLLGFNELGEVRLYELVILPEWCLS